MPSETSAPSLAWSRCTFMYMYICIYYTYLYAFCFLWLICFTNIHSSVHTCQINRSFKRLIYQGQICGNEGIMAGEWKTLAQSSIQLLRFSKVILMYIINHMYIHMYALKSCYKHIITVCIYTHVRRYDVVIGWTHHNWVSKLYQQP